MKKAFLLSLVCISTCLADSLYPEIPLFKDYLLEKEDALHHYGPDLVKGYQSFLLDFPEGTKDQFFTLLDQYAPHANKVIYLTEQERVQYLIHFIHDGSIPEDVPVCIPLMFVMDTEGNFFAREKIRGCASQPGFHHTSFTSAADIAFAGKILVSAEKTLAWISDDSGHFRPLSDSLCFLLSQLTYRGLLLENIFLNLRRTDQLIRADLWLEAYKHVQDPIPGENALKYRKSMF